MDVSKFPKRKNIREVLLFGATSMFASPPGTWPALPAFPPRLLLPRGLRLVPSSSAPRLPAPCPWGPLGWEMETMRPLPGFRRERLCWEQHSPWAAQLLSPRGRGRATQGAGWARPCAQPRGAGRALAPCPASPHPQGAPARGSRRLLRERGQHHGAFGGFLGCFWGAEAGAEPLPAGGPAPSMS